MDKDEGLEKEDEQVRALSQGSSLEWTTLALDSSGDVCIV